MTEPASVVAARQLVTEARQLVTEARDRRAPRPRSAPARRVRAALLTAGAFGTAGCGAGNTACPAIGYSSALVVQLAPDRQPGADRTVELDCEPVCLPPFAELVEASPAPFPGTPGASTPTAPAPTTPAPDPVLEVDDSGRAALTLLSGLPEEVTVRVLEDGAVAAELTVQPEFVRVGGSEECGGPSEAEIVVPAP